MLTQGKNMLADSNRLIVFIGLQIFLGSSNKDEVFTNIHPHDFHKIPKRVMKSDE